MPDTGNLDFIAYESALKQYDRAAAHHASEPRRGPAGLNVPDIRGLLWRAFNAEFDDPEPGPSTTEHLLSLQRFLKRLGLSDPALD